MVFGKTLSLSWKIAVFVVTFAVGIYLIIQLKLARADDITAWFRTGDWKPLLVILLVSFILTKIIEKLLRWEFKLQWFRKRWRR